MREGTTRGSRRRRQGAWRCSLGLRRGSKSAYQGATTQRVKPSKRAAALFFELFAVSGAPMLTYTHTLAAHTHTTLATLHCLAFFRLPPSTHPLTHYCVRAQLRTSGSSGNTAAVTAAATATATAGVSSASIDQGAAIYEYGSTCAFFCIVIIRDPARRVVGGVEFMAEESADGRRHRRGSAAPTTPMIHLHSAQSPARSPAQSTADPQLIHSPIPSPIHSPIHA
jgi:hypothetical protein